MLQELIETFNSIDRTDFIQLGRLLNYIDEKYPAIYSEFISTVKIPKNRANKFRAMAHQYTTLPFDIQLRFEELPPNVRQALLNPATEQVLIDAILSGDITTDSELAKRRSAHKSSVDKQVRVYRDKQLADKIANMDATFKAKFLADLYRAFGTSASRTFTVATRGKDTSLHPNREADFIVEIIGYSAVKQFYDQWLY